MKKIIYLLPALILFSGCQSGNEDTTTNYTDITAETKFTPLQEMYMEKETNKLVEKDEIKFNKVKNGEYIPVIDSNEVSASDTINNNPDNEEYVPVVENNEASASDTINNNEDNEVDNEEKVIKAPKVYKNTNEISTKYYPYKNNYFNPKKSSQTNIVENKDITNSLTDKSKKNIAELYEIIKLKKEYSDNNEKYSEYKKEIDNEYKVIKSINNELDLSHYNSEAKGVYNTEVGKTLQEKIIYLNNNDINWYNGIDSKKSAKINEALSSDKINETYGEDLNSIN